MRQIDESEIKGYLLSGENRTVEYKPDFSWSDSTSLKAKEETIKTIIALSNTPKGGVVVLGVSHIQDKDGKRHEFAGVSKKNLNWFLKNDELVQQAVHAFCSVPADFEITFGSAVLKKGSEPIDFIIIIVKEFSVSPIITIKNSSSKDDTGTKGCIIKENEIYARSFSAIWSSKKCGHRELEDIIKLAADKHRADLKSRGYVKLDSLKSKLEKERAIYE